MQMEKISYLHSSCSDELQVSEAVEMANRILHDPAHFTAIAWFLSSSLNFPLILPTPWLKTPKSAGNQICQKTAGKQGFFLKAKSLLWNHSLYHLYWGWKYKSLIFYADSVRHQRTLLVGMGGGTIWNCKEDLPMGHCLCFVFHL